jgi:hypothetical protein
MLTRDKVSIAVSAAIVVLGSGAVYAVHAAQPKPADSGVELVTPVGSGTGGTEPPTPSPSVSRPVPTTALVTPGTTDERARQNPDQQNPQGQDQRPGASGPTTSSRSTSPSRPRTPKPTTPPVRPPTATPTPTPTPTATTPTSP